MLIKYKRIINCFYMYLIISTLSSKAKKNIIFFQTRCGVRAVSCVFIVYEEKKKFE